MIRLVQRRLIIPRGDTGTFSVPKLKKIENSTAVFTIIDEKRNKRIWCHQMTENENNFSISFEHSDTVNWPVGKFLWDIKFYVNPDIVEGEVVGGEEVDSYYAAYTLPVCEIRQTGDALLSSDDTPTSTLTAESINLLRETIQEAQRDATIAAESRDSAAQSAAAAASYLAEFTDLVIESTVLAAGEAPTSSYNTETKVLTLGLPRNNGIKNIILNNDYTLTLILDDDTEFTTTSVRGPIGATPQLSIGNVQEGAEASATITGTIENPVLNLILPTANVPTRISQLENDTGYLTTETDPTVPQWAKESTKPSYTAQEVGALSDDTYIPQKTSDLINDSNYAVDANYVHTDNNYTTAEKNKLSGIAAGAEVNVNADWNANSGDAQILNKPTKVSAFTNDAGYLTEHQDISGKANKSEIPTKVSQLQNDSGYLTSFTETDPTVPSWAKQQNKPSYTASEVGALPADTAIPTKTSDLTNDSGFISQETDPTVPSWAKQSSKPSYTAAEVGAPTIQEMEQAIANVNTMKIHICAQGEYNSETGVPTIQNPDIQTFYLVPGGEGSNLFIEWVYVNNGWERFGSADVEVPVQDVQLLGNSVVSNGTAIIPIADTQNSYGVVKLRNGTDGLTIDSNGRLSIVRASESELKTASVGYKPVVPYYQHLSTFYGLAKAAGADMKDVSNPTIGTYPNAQKEAIQSMLGISSMLAPENPNLVASQAYAIGDVFTANGKLYKATAAITQDGAIIPDTNCVETNIIEETIKDIQINSSSILSNNVANIPIAGASNLGVVKIPQGGGVKITADGSIGISPASTLQIRDGDANHAIAPFRQHYSVFFGLAKAAGDTTMASATSVGTYTNEAKTAINNMIGSISKESFENAGITSKTYSTKFGGEFSVTTAAASGWLNPYARASVTGRINKENMHRVTFNGTEYILRTRLWYDTTSGLKVYEYLGNLGLYIESTAGVPGGTDNVPFIIISDLNNNNSIDVITQTAGTYTILVEQINPTKIDLPKSLIWGDSYPPIEKNNNGGTYNGFSLGVNELNNKRGTFAFGYGNKIEDEFSYAFGEHNTISSFSSIAFGEKNIINTSNGYAFGYKLNVNCENMIAMGKNNVLANKTFPDWQPNTTYYKGDLFFRTLPDNVTKLLYICKQNYTTESAWGSLDRENSALASSNGDTLFVVGNGSNNDASNAFKIDLIGNVYTGGNIYTNCDVNSQNGSKLITAADIPVTDVQINNTSILSNGIAKIPLANPNAFGAVKTTTYMGVEASSGILYISKSADEQVKAGTNAYRPIVPSNQHAAAFYGLAKAAGDSTQSASGNEVGTYTNDAKAAIQSMLGITDELNSIKTQAAGIIDSLTGAKEIQFSWNSDGNNAIITSGETVDINSVTTKNTTFWRYAVVPCAQGDKFHVHITRADSNCRPWCFVASNGTKLSVASTNNVDVDLVAPENAAYLVCNVRDGDGQVYQVTRSMSRITILEEEMTHVTDQTTLNISGASPTITALPNTRYVCGEVTSVNFTPCLNGICELLFTSGSTITVLTLPNTVKMPEWFEIETNRIYDIIITDGIYGAVTSWAE